MIKIYAGVVVGILALVGASAISSKKQEQELAALEKADDRGTLAWHAKRAKLQGEKQVVIRAPLARYGVADNWNEALSHYSAVVAEPVERKYYVSDDYSVNTWYKFRIIDRLSHPRECDFCSQLAPLPDDMLPLKEDEILVRKKGGTTTVDGIKIMCVDPQFPDFKLSHKYLLFLSLDSAKKEGVLLMGPWGVYSVKSGDVLEIVNPEIKHQLRDEIKTRFGNSVKRIKDHLDRAGN